MGQSTKETTVVAASKAKENLAGVMVRRTTVTSTIMTSRAMEGMSGQTIAPIQANGLAIKCMVMVCLATLMDAPTRAIT